MFTGIVEEKGYIKKVTPVSEQAIQLEVAANKVLSDVKVGDSIALNGICLTVTSFTDTTFHVDVMPETMKATSLYDVDLGTAINLERAMPVDGRFGGHFVTGHVDFTGEIIRKERVENAVYYDIKLPVNEMNLFIQQGSVTIDGVSLTVFAVDDKQQAITISLIPHTLLATNLGDKEVGSIVNVECDVLAKLVQKQVERWS